MSNTAALFAILEFSLKSAEVFDKIHSMHAKRIAEGRDDFTDEEVAELQKISIEKENRLREELSK